MAAAGFLSHYLSGPLPQGRSEEVRGPIGNNFGRPRFSGLTESLFFGGKVGEQTFVWGGGGGGQEDGIAMIFSPSHIYCAQSKVKWGPNGGANGGANGVNGEAVPPPPPRHPHSYATAPVPSQLAPRSVELGAGPNWKQLVHLT